MASHDRATLTAEPRQTTGSRAIRRLRKEGKLPGVLYGSGREPLVFMTTERDYRAALKVGHQLMDLAIDGETIPVIVKEQQHHPVRGGYTHVDLLEVNLKETIQATVSIELIGVEEAPGVVEGGVLDQITRELTIEALPTDIPDSIHIDVSALEMNATLTLAEATLDSNVTVIDELDTVLVSITPPSSGEDTNEEEVEEETEVVGEAPPEAAAAAPDEGPETEGE